MYNKKNSNSNINTYNVRVLRPGYADIGQAMEQNQFKRAEGYRSGGGQGQLWQLAGGQATDQAALDDRSFAMGQTVIQANIHQLPGEAFAALVTGSHGQFERQRDISRLLTLVGMGAGAVVGAAAQTPADALSRLSLPSCVWKPSETRLIQQGHDWLLSLCFETAGGWTPQGRRAAAGVDIGLQPLATAVIGDRFLATQGPDENQVRQMNGFRPDVVEVVESLLAGQGLDLLTDELIRSAGYVAVEALTFSGLREKDSFKRFVSRARASAVVDWHQCWLPQQLRNAGIPFTRVDPRYTSQQCQCGSRMTERDGSHMHCYACGWEGDAHRNAALNICRLGQSRLRRAS
ncbi:transposase [Deinococcus detaillensis]|uniref:Transposase n=1 Tax=Deinococcus detaillensis TaxID=2592048 RepID=A0A553UIF5_9DEIO|nr:zinc ribbon domain-containing protein [Deinococcus detaillensis]TSA79973.1 transposase [Deinococcus detaillensis]